MNDRGIKSLLPILIVLIINIFPMILYALLEFLVALNINLPNMFRWIGIIGIIIVLVIMIIKSVKNYDKDASIYKQALGLIITFAVFCFNPADDIYYYLAAIVSILLTILSFFDIVKKYNLYSTRKLPQLERRGGDENA